MRTEDAQQVEKALAAGEVAGALGILEGYVDLRAADLPGLGKATLKSLASQPLAVRELTLAAVHPSLSVRRFARKYVPKLADSAAPTMLLLAAECMLPMRPVTDPAESLLGQSFDGYSNPLGAAIARQKLSFEEPSPPAVYSKAEKFARDVLDNLLFLLASVSADYFVRFVEYCETLAPNFRYGETETIERSWPHADLQLAAVANWEGSSLLVKSPALAQAAGEWLHLRLLLDQPQSDPAAETLRQRYLQLPEKNRQSARRSLRLAVPRQLFGLKKEARLQLLPLLMERRTSDYPDIDDKFYEKYLGEWLKRNPGELEEAQRLHSGSPEPPAAGLFLPPPTPLDGAGPDRYAVSEGLNSLARALGLAELGKELRKSVAPANAFFGDDEDDEDEEDDDDFEDDIPRFAWTVSGGPSEEQLLRQVATTLGKEGRRIDETALRAASWQRPLADLLLRLGTPAALALREAAPPGWEWDPHKANSDPANAPFNALQEVTDWVMLFLDEEGAGRWGEALSGAFERVGMLHFYLKRAIGERMDQRVLTPVGLLQALALGAHSQALSDQAFQSAVARLYGRPETQAHAEARQAVARIPLPEANNYYRRSHCNDPWRWLCWAAWKRQDAEMLAHLLERCALAYHTKGKPTLPEAPANLGVSNYAPNQVETPGVPLEEVWKLVRERLPERLPAILSALLPLAEFEEFPRVAVRVAARVNAADLDMVREPLLSWLESSQAAVAASALEALARHPGLALGREQWVLDTVRRCLQSPSTALAKEAAAALGTLGAAWDGHGAAAQALLVEGLELDTATVLEQVLRSLKEVRSSGQVGPLDSEAVQRIEQLASKDAKRFEKLARQVLQN